MSRLIALVLLLCASATLTGCNTISGFGRDVEAVGGGVSGDTSTPKKR